MREVKDKEDVLILKKIENNDIDINVKTISKLLELEIDYLVKIEKVLNQ